MICGIGGDGGVSMVYRRRGNSALLSAVIAAWIRNFMFANIAIAIFLFGEER